MADISEDKSLVPIDEIMGREEEVDGISIADFASQRPDPDYVDELPDKDSSVVAGAQTIRGGVYEGSIKHAGSFSSKKGVICENFTVAGTCAINDFLVVKGHARLAGRSLIRGHLIVFENIAIGGNCTVQESIINSGNFRIGGSLTTDQIVSDGSFKIDGKLNAQKIKAITDITVAGQIYIEEDVKARIFHMKSGKGYIKGNLIAEEVVVGENKTVDFALPDPVQTNLTTPLGVFSYVKNILVKYLVHRNFSSRKLSVHGDIHAEHIYLEDAVVEGNIRGEHVIIGPNVIIEGVIEYSEKLTVIEEDEDRYKIHKIEGEGDKQPV